MVGIRENKRGTVLRNNGMGIESQSLSLSHSLSLSTLMDRDPFKFSYSFCIYQILFLLFISYKLVLIWYILSFFFLFFLFFSLTRIDWQAKVSLFKVCPYLVFVLVDVAWMIVKFLRIFYFENSTQTLWLCCSCHDGIVLNWNKKFRVFFFFLACMGIQA